MVVKTHVKGFVITLDPQVGSAGNLATLTGFTVTLAIRSPDKATKITRTPTVSSDGRTATYVTDGTEFPNPGEYALELIVSNSTIDVVSATATLLITARA